MPSHKTKCRLVPHRTLMLEVAMAHPFLRGCHPTTRVTTRTSPYCGQRPAIDTRQKPLFTLSPLPPKMSRNPPATFVKVTQLDDRGLEPGKGVCLRWREALLISGGQVRASWAPWFSAPSQSEDLGLWVVGEGSTLKAGFAQGCLTFLSFPVLLV